MVAGAWQRIVVVGAGLAGRRHRGPALPAFQEKFVEMERGRQHTAGSNVGIVLAAAGHGVQRL